MAGGLAFTFIPSNLRASGDDIAWFGGVLIAIGGAWIVLRRIGRLRPVKATLRKLRELVVAFWAILFGTPIRNRRHRLELETAERVTKPMVQAALEPVLAKIDANVARNDEQHQSVEAQIEQMRTETIDRHAENRVMIHRVDGKVDDLMDRVNDVMRRLGP